MKLKFLTSCTVLLAAVLLNGCGKEDTCSQESVTRGSVQGKWKQNYPTDLEPDFTQPDDYEQVVFKEDSFFLQVRYTTDIVIPGCGNTEYAKGAFTINNGTLSLRGVYTEADYSIKTSSCNHTGAFNRSFDISFCNADLHLYLANSTLPERFKKVILVKK